MAIAPLVGIWPKTCSKKLHNALTRKRGRLKKHFAADCGSQDAREVSVRNEKLKDCLAPLMESLGIAVRVAGELPALDNARSHLFGFLQGGM
jgi:hypothetical protein